VADEVQVEVDGAVAVITINRPQARNAINAAVANGIASALDELDERAGPAGGPERCPPACAVDHPEPQDLLVEGEGAVEIRHLEADPARPCARREAVSRRRNPVPRVEGRAVSIAHPRLLALPRTVYGYTAPVVLSLLASPRRARRSGRVRSRFCTRPVAPRRTACTRVRGNPRPVPNGTGTVPTAA